MSTEIETNKPESSKKAPNHSTEDLLPEYAEVLQGIPEEQREEIERFMVSSFQMMERISPDASLARKITPEHITTILETSNEEMRQAYRERDRKRWFILATIVIASVVAIVLIVLLKDLPDLLKEVLYPTVSAILAFTAGYGIGGRKKQGSEE